MKAVVINGSPRKKGNTAFVCSSITDSLKEKGYSVEAINLCEIDFSTCIGCERCRKDKICTGISDELTPFYDILTGADLWVLGTPVHNYNVTALMKAFIDRLYCFYDFTDSHPRGFSSRLTFKGIKSVVFGVAEQMSEEDFGFTIEAMKMPLIALGVDVLKSFRFFGYFGPGALKKDEDRMKSFHSEFNEIIDSPVS